MNDEEQFNNWLGDAARDYNDPAPVAVPRDAMWTAIRQGLDRPVVAHTERSHVLLLRRSARWLRVTAPYAAAAVLLVAVGFGLGRAGSPTTVAKIAAVPPASDVMYDRATQAHLSRAEVLLTTVTQRSSAADEATARFARDVLTDTRLLLDSPAADDVARRVLLQDLEMLLVQIVQLSSTSTDDHRQLLDRTLERGDLMTRIRLAAPTGVSGT